MIYFTMKNLNENRAFLAMLGFLFVFSCSKDKEEGNGDATKHTLSITKPTGGTLSSDAGGINCGSKGDTCEAKFDEGTEITLTATADKDYVPAAWQGACDKTKATESTCKLSMDADKTVGLTFTNDIDGDSVLNVNDVDDDNDGLIEIHDLDMFDHIRHNPGGTSYRSGSTATANTQGAPEEATDDCKTVTAGVYLCGYELARDLDFSDEKSYAVGSAKKSAWQPNKADPDSATNEGFVGIDDFAGTFEGNGYSISQLYGRSISGQSGSGLGTNMGLFAGTTDTATIRNMGVAKARLYSVLGFDFVGALVGINSGSIVASYATGAANGGAGDDDVGGLVGLNYGSIVASYATGAANGGGDNDDVGGLVGINSGSIVASYATGAANGGAGDDGVGGLVGFNSGSIVASYATGAANGGAGDDDVGGLVGLNYGSIVASYATGAVNGGVGVGSDNVGGLVGINDGSATITASYGFGNATMGTVSTDGSPPMGVARANGLTADNAGTEWNDSSEKTKDAWDFGTGSQPPALRYADYDGAGSDTYDCGQFPAKIPGTSIDLECGKSLLPEQRP